MKYKNAALILPIAVILLSGCHASTSPTVATDISEIRAAMTKTEGKEAADLKLVKSYTGSASPTAVAVDAVGRLYVSCWSGGSVMRVDESGTMTVFASDMGAPAGLAFDGAGDLYVSDYSRDVIYRVSPSGEKTVFAEGLHTPTGIAFGRDGRLIVADRASDEIVTLDGQGNVVSVVGGMATPVGVVEDGEGSLLVTNYGGPVKKIARGGQVNDFTREFARPGVGIDISERGEIFAADNGAGCVRQIFFDGTTKVAIDGIGGCVGVKVHGDTLYVTSWRDGAVYAYAIGR